MGIQNKDPLKSTTCNSAPLNAWTLAVLSVFVGIVAGFGAVIFRGLIGFFHNLLFLGKFSFAYDANLHTPPGPWGPLVILVPVVGALGVSFLVNSFAPEAKGHGVPEVIDAIYYQRGRIRPVVALIKSLASALSIGSGGSVGREGPIIQIGSSFGSTIGQFLRVPSWQLIVLIAGGAGSGIGATFNTPVGGVLFALEIMMHEISVRTVVPVALATASGTYIGRLFFGQHPSFAIPSLETPYFHVTRPLVLLSYVGLGIISGAVCALYIKSIYGTEDLFDQRIGASYYRKHLLGMLIVGLILYALMATFGHYYVEGVGYATVQQILSGQTTPFYLLLLLFVAKLLVTSVTLGSGASGGIFSPALFLGATLGSAYGMLLNEAFPHLGISAPAFAVAGMAGVVGGATGAAMAAIVMIFEMTLDYNVIVPMTITVALSYGIRKALCRQSIYNMKLTRRGHYVPEALHASPHLVQPVERIMGKQFTSLAVSSSPAEIIRIAQSEPFPTIFLIHENNRLVGFLTSENLIKALLADSESIQLVDLVDRNYVLIDESTSLFDTMGIMRAHNTSVALVRDAARSEGDANAIRGVLTDEQLGEVMLEGSELFLD